MGSFPAAVPQIWSALGWARPPGHFSAHYGPLSRAREIHTFYRRDNSLL